MFNSLFSPTIFKPKSLYELNNIINKNKEVVLYSGGTYIMTKILHYPKQEIRNIADIKNIEELKVFINTDSSLVFGSVNTFNFLTTNAKFLLDEYLLQSFSSLNMSQVIKDTSTLGGAISSCNISFYNSVIASLIHSNSKITFEYYKNNKFSIVTMPLQNFFKSHYFSDKPLIRRIEIPKMLISKNSKNLLSYYREVGNYFNESNKSLVFIGTYGILRNEPFLFKITLLFHDLGFISISENIQEASLSNYSLLKNIREFSLKIIEKIKHSFEKENKIISEERLLSTRILLEDFFMKILENY